MDLSSKVPGTGSAHVPRAGVSLRCLHTQYLKLVEYIKKKKNRKKYKMNKKGSCELWWTCELI